LPDLVNCRNGQLVLAATRGDGTQGEDVTHNALTGAIQGLPLTLAAHHIAGSSSSSSSSNGNGGVLQLPSEVEVRGEVFMTTSDFEQVGFMAERVVVVVRVVSQHLWRASLGLIACLLCMLSICLPVSLSAECQHACFALTAA
jgi:hypothetical protein